MFSKKITTLVVAASLALFPTSRVAADAGDIAAGVLLGVLGSAAANNSKSKKRYTGSSGVSSATRAANREVQESLNYFSFPAGSPDGVLGKRSRAAISNFQVFMGFQPTGKLNTFERDFLVTSYHRAVASGHAAAQIIATNPMGTRALLKMYWDEKTNGGSGNSVMAGATYGLPTVVAAAVHEIAKSADPTAEQLVQRSGFIQLADLNADGKTDYILDTSVTGSAFWCNAQSCAVRVFASTPEGYERNDFQAFNVVPAMFTCQRGNCAKTGSGQMTALATQPPVAPPAPQPQIREASASPTGAVAPVPTAQPAVRDTNAGAPALLGGLPSFMGQAAEVSLASHCNKVSLVTSSNGGFTTLASMSDPEFTLGEQFCLARTYAIATGEDLTAKVQGFTAAQIESQCAAFGPAMQEYVAALSLKSSDDVLRDVSSFVLKTGMSPAQLAGTAKICLSVGYRTDQMDVAIGSALLLIALGERVYGELPGHHLSLGFGATQRADLAQAWYGTAIEALSTGATPVFAPGQPERPALLQRAALGLTGNGDQANAAAPTGLIPAFSVSE